MTQLIRRTFAALIALSSAIGAQGTPAPSTTVIVVRHGERAAEPAADPILTPAGSARADALAELVKDAGVKAVVSTQFQRTRLTVAPTAAKLGLTAQVMDARAPGHARMVADSVLAKHRGQVVLVAGHSNTVPDIVAAFGAPKPADICDAGYDNLFIVTVPASGPASVVRLRYGAPTSCP